MTDSASVRAVLLLLVFVGAGAALVWALASIEPNESPALEQSLSSEQLHELKQSRALFGSEQAFMLALVEGVTSARGQERIQSIAERIRGVAGIAWVWAPREPSAPSALSLIERTLILP